MVCINDKYCYSTLDKIKDAIILINNEGNICHCNDAAQHMFEYDEIDLLEKNIFEVLCPEEHTENYKKTFELYKSNPNLLKNAIELTNTTKAGLPLYTEVTISDILLEETSFYILLFRDITARKQTEISFQEYQDFYHNITSQALDAIIMTDEHYKIVYWNPAAEKIFGYTYIEVIDKTIYELVAPFGKEKEYKTLFSVKKKKGLADRNAEERIARKKDGTEFPVEISMSTLESGGNNHILALIHDITARKEMQDNLIETNTKFQAITDTALEAFVLMDEDYKIVLFNKAAEEKFQYKAAEVLNKKYIDYFIPDRLKKLFQKLEKEINETGTSEIIGKLNEFTLKRKDNSELITECSISLIYLKGKRHLLAVIRNITDKKKAEKEIKEAHLRMQSITENTLEGIVLSDEENKVVFWNSAAENIFGYKKEEIVGQHLFDYIAPERFKEYFHRVADIVLHELENEFINKTTEFIFKDSCNEEFIAEVSLVRFELNEKPYITGIIRDVSERKQAEQEIHEANMKFQAITNSTLDAIIMINGSGEIEFWSNSAEKLLGYTPGEVYGKNLHKLIAPERYQKLSERGLKHFKSSGQGEALNKTLELSAIRKDGQEIIIELSLSALKLKKEWHAVGILRDITERVETEEKMLEIQQKLQGISDCALDAIIMINSKDEIIHWSKSAEKIFEYSAQEIYGQSLHKVLVPESYYKQASKALGAFKDSGMGCALGKVLELTAKTKSGKLIDIELSLSALKLKNEWHAVGVVRDITERKMEHNKLVAFNSFFNGLIETFRDRIFIISEDRDIIRINPDSDAIIQKADNNSKCYNYIYGEDECCSWCRLDEVFKGQTIQYMVHNEKTGKKYICLSQPYRYNNQNYALTLEIDMGKLDSLIIDAKP
jgi:PAS domain S-box-containing protein